MAINALQEPYKQLVRVVKINQINQININKKNIYMQIKANNHKNK
jgi:hypothetical protein